MTRFLSLAVVLPLVLSSGSSSLDPALEISCGRLPGDASPNDVILHAGPNSPSRIHVQIRAVALDPTLPADTRTELAIAAGGFSASCTTDLGGHHHIYLNAPETGEVALTFRGYHAVTLRGLRGEREQSSVTIDPSGHVDAALTW